jgi:hypothetical protein
VTAEFVFEMYHRPWRVHKIKDNIGDRILGIVDSRGIYVFRLDMLSVLEPETSELIVKLVNGYKGD